MKEGFIIIHESLDDSIFIDLKIELGNDIKRYDDKGIITNNCANMKRVQCGDIFSIKNIPERTSPVYEGFDGWFTCKGSRNVKEYDIPFLRDSFMLCVYSFVEFKNVFKKAVEESGFNYVANIKFELGNQNRIYHKGDTHRIGLINTDGSEICIKSNENEHNEFYKGLLFFYLKPEVEIYIKNGNRFCLLGSVVSNYKKLVSPILESKKRKYRDLNSESFNELKDLMK